MAMTSRASYPGLSPYSSLIEGRFSATVGDCGGKVKERRHGGEQEPVPSIQELWDMAESLFPDKMACLHDAFLKDLGNLGERRSLLKDGVTERYTEFGQISDRLTKATSDNYTPKFNSMFLLHFDKSNRSTDDIDDIDDIDGHDDHDETLDHKYMRLGTTHDERKEEGYDAKLHDVKHSFTSDKSLQLVLLFNHLFDYQVNCEIPAHDVRFENADSEPRCMWPLFDPAAVIVERLFYFTRGVKLGLRVKAKFDATLPYGTRKVDFAVTVNTVNEDNGTITSTECVSVVEFKRANAGLWIAWGPLTGQSWTGAERNAFFKLKKLRIQIFGWCLERSRLEKLLNSWQNNPMWKSAEDALERIGSHRVRAKYDRTETSSGQTEEDSDGRAEPTSDQNSQIMESGELAPSYHIEAANGDPEDITPLLDSAKFKTSFDSVHDVLAQAASYAVLNKCSRVAIADGLTFIAGSLNKLEKAEGFSNPTDSDDVLDAHFYNTHMIQTHDQDSLVHIVNYFVSSVMSCSSMRSAGHQLLLYAKPGQDAKVPTAAPAELETMIGHAFSLSSANPGVKSPALEKSRQLLTNRVRGTLVQALTDICKRFPELYAKLDHITSDSFGIVKSYRRDIHEFYFSEGSPFPGRSKSVASVQRHGDTPGTHLILKEYYSDEDSVARMRRELEAYCRVSRLPNDQRTKHVADLVSFGSLDLNEGAPRLFLMLECVEGPNSRRMSIDQSVITAEVDRVHSLLTSVGVDHNDLIDRNYRLQPGSDGNWYIKVFDFDIAIFEEPGNINRL